MNQIKFIFCIIVILLFSGCNGSYNLYIDDKGISEDIYIDTSNLSNDIINKDYYPFNYDFTKVFDRKISNVDGISILNLKYKYSFDEFLNSTAYNTCFSNRKYENTNDFYYINLNHLVECFYGQEFDINIITKNKVLMNNADSAKGNTYTWHVTEDNKDDLSIEIKIAKGQKAFDNSIIVYVLFGIIVVIIIFTIRWFINKRKVRNDF